MRNYSNIGLKLAGLTAFAALTIGCRITPKYDLSHPFNQPISNFSVRQTPSGAPVIVQMANAETPVFSEPAEDSYQGSFKEKGINVIVKNKRKATVDIAAKVEAGKGIQEARLGTKGIFREGEWRIIPELMAVAARKEYDNGTAAETEGLVAGARVGKYTNIGKWMNGVANDLNLYLEARLHGEGGQYSGRTKEKHQAILAGIGLGLFSKETGTYFRAILAGGAGNFEMDLTNISAEEKARIGLDSDVKRVNDSLERWMADFQLRKRFLKLDQEALALYGKGRFNISVQDRENWNDYIALASELGLGLQGETAGLLKRWYVEAMATHRDETNDFFNGRSKHRNILGARLGIGAQVGRHTVVEAATECDDELMLRIIAQVLFRF